MRIYKYITRACIFNNVNNQSKLDLSGLEKKLEILENAIRKKSPQENLDFENTIIRYTYLHHFPLEMQSWIRTSF